MEIKQIPLVSAQVEELACQILGLDYDKIDGDEEIIEEKLIEVFNMSLVDFAEVVGRLVPLIDIGESPMTGKQYKGFAEGGMWFVKTEIA